MQNLVEVLQDSDSLNLSKQLRRYPSTMPYARLTPHVHTRRGTDIRKHGIEGEHRWQFGETVLPVDD